MSIVIAYQKDLPKSLQQKVQLLENQQWPNAKPDKETMLQFLYMQGKKVIAHAGLQTADVNIQGISFRAAGLCAVIVDKQYRHQGIASHVLFEVKNYLLSSVIDICIFTCAEKLVPFYEHAGFMVHHQPLIGGTMKEPLSSKDLHLITMSYICSTFALTHQNLLEEHAIRICLGKGSLW